MATFGSSSLQDSMSRLQGATRYTSNLVSTSSLTLPPELDIKEPLVPVQYKVFF